VPELVEQDALMLPVFIIASEMRDRYGEAPGRGFGERALLDELEDPFDPGTLCDVVPVPPNVKAGGDNSGEQEEQSCAQPSDSLPQLLEAPLSSWKPSLSAVEESSSPDRPFLPQDCACQLPDADRHAV